MSISKNKSMHTCFSSTHTYTKLHMASLNKSQQFVSLKRRLLVYMSRQSITILYAALLRCYPIVTTAPQWILKSVFQFTCTRYQNVRQKEKRLDLRVKQLFVKTDLTMLWPTRGHSLLKPYCLVHSVDEFQLASTAFKILWWSNAPEQAIMPRSKPSR